MNWTTQSPSISGYYYLAPSKKDWDLYKPVAVQSILDSSGLRFEVYTDPEGYRNFRWINVASPELSNFIWWGPLPKPERPEDLS